MNLFTEKHNFNTTLTVTIMCHAPDDHHIKWVLPWYMRHICNDFCENQLSSFLYNPNNKQTNERKTQTSLAEVINFVEWQNYF